MTADPTTASIQNNDGPVFRDSFERRHTEIDAVADANLITLNVDIPSAVMIAIGAVPPIRALRPKMAELPGLDINRVDNIEDYAMAAGYAHALFMAASRPPEELETLVAEATRLREILYSDASALATRDIIDGARLKDLKGPVGYKNLAFDLMTLTATMNEHWQAISGKSAVTAAEIARAEKLGTQIMKVVALREQAPNMIADAARTRLRAFSLFYRAYDEARRAVTFLRWYDADVERVVPTLYGPRTRHKGDDGTSPVPPVEDAARDERGSSMEEHGSAGTTATKPAGPVGSPTAKPFLS